MSSTSSQLEETHVRSTQCARQGCGQGILGAPLSDQCAKSVQAQISTPPPNTPSAFALGNSTSYGLVDVTRFPSTSHPSSEVVCVPFTCSTLGVKISAHVHGPTGQLLPAVEAMPVVLPMLTPAFKPAPRVETISAKLRSIPAVTVTVSEKESVWDSGQPRCRSEA